MGKLRMNIEGGCRKDVILRIYIKRAIPITLVAFLLSLLLRKYYLVIYFATLVVLIMLAVRFLMKDVKALDKIAGGILDQEGIRGKLKGYFEADDAIRIKGLAKILARHEIVTKEDLKLAMDYFKLRLPINTKPNLSDWILTVVITLASVAIVAYDETTSTVNMRKFASAFISALIVAAMTITPILVFKIVRYVVSRFRNRVDAILVEDLAYIYIHFGEYEETLKEN